MFLVGTALALDIPVFRQLRRSKPAARGPSGGSCAFECLKHPPEVANAAEDHQLHNFAILRHPKTMKANLPNLIVIGLTIHTLDDGTLVR